VPPRRALSGVEWIDGTGGDRAGGEHQHGIGQVVRKQIFA